MNLMAAATQKYLKHAAFLLALLALLLWGGKLWGQADYSANPHMAPKFDMSLGYDYIRGNAPPPTGCPCFSMSGGYLSGAIRVKNWLGIEGRITGGHQNNISSLHQDLTLLTYMGGPKVQMPGLRFSPFAQALFGEAYASDSYFPVGLTGSSPTANSLAISAGGGLDYNLNRRLAIRAFNVEYFRTTFPNGSTNEQNHLMASAGIVVKFGIRMPEAVDTPKMPPPPPPPPGPKPDRLAFSCTSNVAALDQGDTLEVVGNTLTEPPGVTVDFTWSTTKGTIVGHGPHVLLDTQDLPPGTYTVLGHAMTTGPVPVSAYCEVPFRIKTMQQTLAAPTPAPVARVPADRLKEFHQNVPDALFDFDSAVIRPDTERSIEHAAAYLKAHPEIGVLLGGYADDRGSIEYNLALGEKRAAATRRALIAAGVEPERLEIVTYGKEVQVCTAMTEECRQENRRVMFNMRP